MKRIPESEWKWFGESAHFICGQWCRFHMATLVGNLLVSTVGKYVHPRNSGASELVESQWLAANPNGEPIGYVRYYETMVFAAGETCATEGCKCGMPAIASGELEAAGYNDAGAATRGHMAMCDKVARVSSKVASK